MADLPALLAVLEHDPDDAEALDALVASARSAPPETRPTLLSRARKALAQRGRPDVVARLLDAELQTTAEPERSIDLLLEQGMLLESDLLDVSGARAAFAEVLRRRPDDALALEAQSELAIAEENWQKFAAKYLQEADGSTDRGLATGLYVSAAETYVRFAPGAPEAEAYLRKALEIDPRNGKAAFHLARLLRGGQRWSELAALYDDRAAVAATPADKISALLGLAAVSRDHLGDAVRAQAAIQRVLVLDPAQPQALRSVTHVTAAAGDWHALLAQYQAALKANKDAPEDVGMLLQIAMVLWKHLGELDQAEDYFRRVRRTEPAHPAALDFYREYYPAKGETAKLLALLKSVEKSGPIASGDSQRTAGGRARPISREIAELSETQQNPEKAIEAWKQHLRSDPSSQEARAALGRLYRKTEKWNALLDLMKDEIERVPEGDAQGRVARMFDVVEIYRDRLRLDVMVINTYNAILKLDPDNQRATDELAAKYRALGRWNDVIALLSRKADAPGVPDADRVTLLREIADLWAERFGNFANAIKPLERILEIAPADADALARLKDIYTRRRQWRQLVDVLAREAATLPAAERRVKQGEMARLAAERLGDTRLAIEIHNLVLAEADGEGLGETLSALAALYEREKRYLALAEILARQVATATGKDAIALLEKLGQIYADRVMAPALAAAAWQQILDIDPQHAKALRTLRELYATAGDFAGLERLYAKLGQEDELVEALLNIADRIEARAARIPVVERAAQLAQRRAEAAPEAQAAAALERARQVWERVLAVDAQNVGAAQALAPIYGKQEKWARLIAVLEIALAAAPDPAARLATISQIRQICEQRLSSRNLAFLWTVRAFDLDPDSDPLFSEVQRLASEPEQWREVVAAFEGHLPGGDRRPEVTRDTQLRLLRELARIANKRLGDLERARGYHQRVLALAPDDDDAEAALEDIAAQLADWPELLASYRRRAARETDATGRAALLLDIAALQEEKLVDLDGAAAAYHEALAAVPGNVRALRAVARIEEARGDWESLADVLVQELAQTPESSGAGGGQARFELLMRLGKLEEGSLERPARALAFYREALGILGPTGAARPAAVAAMTKLALPERRGAPGHTIDPTAREPITGPDRVAAARLLLPHLEAAKQVAEQARALEVLRAAPDASEHDRGELDRQLMRFYHTDLGDPAAAWDAGLRVLAAEPADVDVRSALGVLAGQLGRDGEWQRHLTTALGALRPKHGPPGEVRALATELARLSGERLADRPAAERAWLVVLEVEPDAPDAFDALAASYRAEERLTDLRALLERRAEVTVHDAERRAALLELAILEEDLLGDPARAGAAHRRVLELEPAYVPSYVALDRLYTGTAKWADLEELLARQLDHTPTPSAQIELTFRRGELFARRLGDVARAVDLLEDVIGRARGHADARRLLEELLRAPAGTTPEVAMRIARLLEPLYEQDKAWPQLVETLRAQRALVTGPEAVELLARIASIEEVELGGAGRAFDAWAEVLRLDPTHERARTELTRLASWLSRWPEATTALEAAAVAAPASDIATRAALLGDLATYYDTQTSDAPRAIAAYQRLLEVDPNNAVTIRRAGAALARLYEEAGAWAELRSVTRRQAEWAEDPAQRRALLARVAALEEDKLGDRAAAIVTWRDVTADQPTDAGALHALERLFQATERWRELVEVLRRKVELAAGAEGGHSGEDPKALLSRIAEVHEVMLEEPGEAIAAHLEILDLCEHGNADDRASRSAPAQQALAELARLYREGHRPVDLIDILERQLAAGPAPGRPDTRVALEVEIAQLLAGPLARPTEALERWARVLRAAPVDDPASATALAALEAALDDVDLRGTAAELLQPYYDATGRDERLAALHARLADWADDPSGKLRALGEVVRIREHRLGDRAAAFAAQLQILRVAASEPELARAVVETERLAGELGREADLIEAYREVAPHVLDAEIQRRLYLDVADLARAVRRDLALAREYYQKVLDAQPEDARALAALESIYRETNDDLHLVEVLLRQAELASSDGDDRLAALVEAAGIYAHLGRPDDAIATWEQVLASAPERRDAVDALEPLYREQGRWPDVVDLYERRLGFATSIDEAVRLRVQLGAIHEAQMRDVENAIENYSAALSGDPRNADALAALERFLGDPDVRAAAAEVLEPIYVGQYRWTDLIRVYEAKLEGASDPRERLRLTRFVARLYEEQLEDFENASRWYARVFREAPGDPGVRDQLQRLASIVDNWAFVAATYQAFLDEEAGETAEVREVAIAAAGIYDRRLGDPDRAFHAYRRALAIPPVDAADDDDAAGVLAFLDERELIRRLEDLLGRATKWRELVSVYEDVIGRADDELRREALVKRARLLEDGLEDLPRTIDAWREVVVASEDSDPVSYREAVRELERLYRDRAQWHDLVDLFESRLVRAQDPTETAELRLRLAELLETQLADIPSALDQYEHVIAERRLWDRAVAALERIVVHETHRERITELLEPVYREQDWWQKLVVILDAKLAYVRDPVDQVLVLHEIAELHERRGGALDLALTALARAWRIDVTDDESLSKLLVLSAKLDAWDEAVQAIEAGAPTAPNSDLAAGLWARAAEIHEARRGDSARAIDAWRKVDEARPDDMVALAALDRLLAVAGRVGELVTVVERRAELTDDAGVRLVLLHRVAALYEDVLDDKPRAVGAYKNVLGVDDTDLTALDALDRLYRSPDAGGTARDLAETLERKIELTGDIAGRQELRRGAAQVYERDLADVYQAIAHLVAILDDDAGDGGALSELDRIYGKEKMHADLLEVIDRRALLATVAADRADLAYRAAHLVETELRDPEAAIPRYGAVLQVSAAHAPARAALEQLMLRDEHALAVAPILERVYRADRDAAGLIRVYERRLSVSGGLDPSARRADWTALAEVHETLADAPTAAFGVWSRALAAEPEDLDLLTPLQRLAESQNLWSELAALLDAHLAPTAQPLPAEVEQTYAMRLGAVAEDRLNDLARAAAAYQRASHGPEPRSALTALERVLARSSKWPELADALRRQADAAEDDSQTADYLYRLGDLQETTLRDPRAAVTAYREVLAILPKHQPARAALERLLQSAPEHRAEIVDILEPLFEQDSDSPRLATVIEARLAITHDALDQAALLQRLAELAEHRLGDRARALDAVLRWLAADPTSQHALSESERLAERLGQWSELAQRVGAIVTPSVPADARVSLQVFLGRVQRERLGALDAAVAAYRAALALEPDELTALDPLIEILRQRGDHAALAEALRHRGTIVADVAERRAAFTEVAQLSERMRDTAAAIAAWREVADTDDASDVPLRELARIYRELMRSTQPGDAREQLIEVLGKAARVASAPADEKALRVEIAHLEGEGPRAVGAWQAVLDLDGDDPAVLSALEAAHGRAGDYLAVADLQTRRLALARTSSEKVAIHAEMARVAETKRDAIDDAVASWFAALDLDGAYQPAFTELERLLAGAARWHDLVELLERRAELYGTLSDGPAEIATLARAADVWEAKLDDPDAAGAILEKILAREPGSVAALTRLSKIYERAGDWTKCKGALEQALALQPTGRDAADLFFRLGEVAREGDGDPATAVQHYQQALRHDGAHPQAIAALEAIARERRDGDLLADMLRRRAAAATAPAERVALHVEVAELERKAGRAEAALAALAKAAVDAPGDLRVLGPLADLYFATGRLDEAAPIYDKLAEEAKAARRMKDVARYRQRQGGILEARGDAAGALAAYEEALRVNPTDVATMTGLGRLYFAAADWEKARRIYQSLVLQNIEPDAGVTKGEVYWALGRIMGELGQGPKAKSMYQRGLEIEPGNQKLKDALAALT